MIRPGIYKSEQLTKECLDDPRLSLRRVSILLYEEIAGSEREDRDRLLEHILLRFQASSGVYKRTYSQRMIDFDSKVVELIRSEFSGSGACDIYDLGVSDGRTSFELYQALSRVAGLQFNFLATDYCPYLTAVSKPGGRLALILDKEERLLQMVFPPFVFNVPERESIRYHPVNCLVRGVLLATAAPALVARYKRRDSNLVEKPITLVHPDCRALVKTARNFHFEQYDLLRPMPSQYHVIRAMNVMQEGYFSAEQLRRGIRNVFDGLFEGGLFVTGRNEERVSPVDGSVFRKKNDGFQEVFATGAGAPVRDVVMLQGWRRDDVRV